METPELMSSVAVVAQLVDLDVEPGGGAVAVPAVVGGVVGQRAAAAVDAGAEHRP
jgi:hypothetical protein